MTSRERVLSAVNHIEPDRVPVDFGGHRSSGIMAIAYRRLRDFLGLPKRPIKVFDMIQQLAVIDEDVLDLFGVDTVELGRGFSLGKNDWKQWVLPDGSECLIPAYVDVRKKGDAWYLYSPSGIELGVQRPSMLYFDQTFWPYKERIPQKLDVASALSDVIWSIPSPPDLSSISLEEFAERSRAFRVSTDRAILFLFGGNFLEIASFLCSIENFMMLMALEPKDAHRLLDAVLEHHLKNIEKFLGAVGTSADIVLFGDDLGMQSGPQISADMYREFIKPREKVLWAKAKELAPHIKTQLHSCGGVRPFMGDFIEIGLDSLNPIQTSSAGMEPEGLKRDFGKGICLWGGGCDTQSVLPNGRPEEVKRHVKERLSILAPGGGFVFQQVHNIMANVPPENIVAMFEAVKEYNESS